MISNLNTIARTDESLNQLMKIVALGKATPQQISTFQGYIKRARDMGPQPHHAYLFANQPYTKSMKPPKEKKPVKDKKLKDIPRNQKLTAFQERYTNNATLLFEFVENPNVRFMLPKVAVAEILPPSTMTNADGEDNSDNKDILISFIWVHNQKEVDTYEEKLANYNKIMAERDAEAKKIEDAKKAEEEEAEKAKSKETQDNAADEGKIQSEKPTGEDDDGDSTENQTEVKTETTDTPAISEDQDNKDPVKEEPKDEAKEAVEVPTPAKRRLPPRKASKKKKVPPRKGPKKLEKPIEPEIRFTTMSHTVHGIPSRYVPIIMNSFEPLDKVQEKMKHILEVGTRTSSFYLWFQVDGKLDEKLAEEIRSQLVQEEKKMPGVVNAVKEVKKRQKKDPLVPKAKKIKLEGNSDTGPSANNALPTPGPVMETSPTAPSNTAPSTTTPSVPPVTDQSIQTVTTNSA
jgi:SWR1-complex protein 3